MNSPSQQTNDETESHYDIYEPCDMLNIWDLFVWVHSDSRKRLPSTQPLLSMQPQPSALPLPIGPPSKPDKPRKTRSDKGKPRGKGPSSSQDTQSNSSTGSPPDTHRDRSIGSPPSPHTDRSTSGTLNNQCTSSPPDADEPPAKRQRKTRADCKLWPKATDENLGGGFFMSVPVTPATFKRSA